MKKRVMLDSSFWIELLSKGPKYAKCKSEIREVEIAPVPAIVFYEVYKRIASKMSSELGLSTVAWLRQYGKLALTDEVALLAADLSIELKLGMADSIVLAHAMDQNATLVTLDNEFSFIERVKVIR